MGSSEKYGRLYAYFLEVCRHFLYRKLHHEMRVPQIGQEMYEFLNRRLSDKFKKIYDAVLRDSEFLSDRDRNYLSPENRIINVSKLDISIQIKIIRLLKAPIGRRRWEYIASIRNYLCHIPNEELRRNMTQQEFESKLYRLKRNLESVGTDRDLLNSCERNILNGRNN